MSTRALERPKRDPMLGIPLGFWHLSTEQVNSDAGALLLGDDDPRISDDHRSHNVLGLSKDRLKDLLETCGDFRVVWAQTNGLDTVVIFRGLYPTFPGLDVSSAKWFLKHCNWDSYEEEKVFRVVLL